MAKNALDVVTDVRLLINTPAIIAMLSGGRVDPSVKTTNSTIKGVVVNCLGVTNTQDQVALGNVNCYCPAIISMINGKSVSLPDHPALGNLATAIEPLINSVRNGNFECWITKNASIEQDTDGSYFANIQYEYRSSQSNFKNI